MKRRHEDAAPPPPGLAVLASEDGEIAFLSFELAAGDRDTTLSPAESEVVALIAAGRSNREIASSRRTAINTVANQVASLFRKLGVRSRLELLARAALVCPMDISGVQATKK